MREETGGSDEAANHRATAPAAPSAPQVSTPFDRAMFAVLIPAFLLPPLAIFAAWLGEASRGRGDAELIALVIGVFMFVQLGSQVLNAWLILRRPESYFTRALPRTLSLVQVIIYGIIVLWSVVLSLWPDSGASFVFGGILAVLGVVALVSILQMRRGAAVPMGSAATRLSSVAQSAILSYVVVAVAGLVAATAIAFAQVTTGSAVPPIAGLSALILVLLGLPWSHTLYGMLFAALVLSGTDMQSIWVVLPILAIPVLANITVAVTLMVSPARGRRLISRFFRLNNATD